MALRDDWVDENTPGKTETDWTFTAAAANLVAAQVNTLSARVVTPEDFGAVGDGITDDSAALQDALDTLNETTVLVIAPGKAYAHTATLAVTTDGGTICGGGEIRATAENTSGFKIQGDYITVENIMHYHRWYRHGDVDKTEHGTGTFERKYRRLFVPSHPLAAKNGTAYEHRVVPKRDKPKYDKKNEANMRRTSVMFK